VKSRVAAFVAETPGGGIGGVLPSGSAGRPPHRLWALGALAALELVAISLWLDTGSLRGGRGLIALVANYGPDTLRVVVAAVLTWLVFGDASSTEAQAAAPLTAKSSGVRWPLLAAHAGLLLLFTRLSSILFGVRLGGSLDTVVAALWIACGVAAGLSAALAFVPLGVWVASLRRMRSTLAFALAVGIGAQAFASLAVDCWRPLSRLTLTTASAMLAPFVDGVRVEPSRLLIAAPHFQVVVSAGCSGYEGLGLILVFTSAWLWFHRQEWRFPQALTLVPVGLASMWTVNCARIATLVFIGNAGAPAVAAGGFHSQAGWLGFIAVTLAMCLGARRVPWLVRKGATDPPAGWTNPTAPYVLPFVAILAGAMSAKLGSSGFEWLYPMRVVAGAAALACFARSYRSLDWRIGWVSPVLGALVFLMWIFLEPNAGAAARAPMPSALGAAPAALTAAWLAVRVLGSVVTVPIAEELAFRGFLLRRFVSADFQAVSSRSISWIAIVLSSAAFGVLHGDRWLAGTLAGVVYAGALLRRGSLGDATAAHATTNLLIAGWVGIGGHWEFW
jgi:exosortase E/protease (VPEID-CTERM system)